MFTTAVNLLEAEGRLARLYVVRVAASLFVVFFAMLGAALGLLAALVGVTWVLMNALGGASGLVISGVVVALAGAVTAWLVYRKLLDSSGPPSVRASSQTGDTFGNNHHEPANGPNRTNARGDRVPQDAPSHDGAQAVAS